MSSAASSTSSATNDECTICLNALTAGLPLLTLSCGHKFHLQCLALNVKAQNKECPLCRSTLETSLSQLLSGVNNNVQQQQQQQQPPSLNIIPYGPCTPSYRMVRPSLRPSTQSYTPTSPAYPPMAPSYAPSSSPSPAIIDDIPSVEELVNEDSVRKLSSRIASTQQAAASSTSKSSPLITALTTLEFGGQISDQETNIYGLVTLKAPSINPSSTDEASSSPSRVPIDLVCVVDQSGSMGGEKMDLLKETLVYIAEQLNEFDRLSIVSFDTEVFDRSHGLKRMNEVNQQALKRQITDHIHASGGTYIGCGLKKGIEIFTSRQTKNPISALLLLTDGQDNDVHDYSQLMQTFPEDVVCHTFGYGPDNSASLLTKLAELGNGGTFTYVDQQQAVGPAFATVIGGLLSCVAQKIRVNIEFDGEYQVTHVHSKYKHEPDQLPSSKMSYILTDLNADEQRNLIFQLRVPKINTEQSVAMLSQDPISQSSSEEDIKSINNHVIGRVSITYVDPNSNETLNTTPVPFHLIRTSQLSADILRTNHTLDLQRNRVETAFVLKQAMDETDYQKSLAILKSQVQKIEASVSAQDPFCQQLINDLKLRYPTEDAYRSTNYNYYLQQATERGTYASAAVTSVQMYMSPQQQSYSSNYGIKRLKPS